jgi:hypothetical protein
MKKIMALRQHQVVVRQRAAAVDALLIVARRPFFDTGWRTQGASAFGTSQKPVARHSCEGA